ncbi:GntR family transcriptional regulator [Vibrio parahaemolyticus]|uniref:GntR family transcriptional regulator n=1 Tax=Vibrio parahaemolyticus TaxID=670 RepID=UPI00111D38C8|nr:GntR family transcriptional regulator [Vibrio parahaemolyticus]MBM4862710.1 GntR family transcriptional regulator [Vibrio parahaemolyticus]MBM4952080.1 GntR family transcriptional regulator [Vibrio parahaemolyticus]MDA0386397.1 GntR family transcriptional regulator [Vibrio parahaemolyticus]MDA0390942.1 GntR family transcriptional regulator [Vibrio parahaemolyticus]MDA0396253.1 GntR family transcriptional regulator [Vibrio parahaemolyticus]
MARLPMYRQIADAIRDKISEGEYKVGTALPTEAQLREAFSCSRVTVRQALKLLVENGELESVQGSGTYVKESKVNYDIYQQSSFAEKWAHLDAATHSDVIAFEITKATLTIADALNIGEGDKIFYVKRVRYLDDKPITVEETWLPTEMFPDLTYQVMQGSKYQFIENDKGMVIDRSEQEIIPVLAPEDIAELLDIDPTQPIIEKRTRGFLQGDVVFEYSRNYFKPTEYKFTLVAKRHHSSK